MARSYYIGHNEMDSGTVTPRRLPIPEAIECLRLAARIQGDRERTETTKAIRNADSLLQGALELHRATTLPLRRRLSDVAVAAGLADRARRQLRDDPALQVSLIEVQDKLRVAYRAGADTADLERLERHILDALLQTER